MATLSQVQARISEACTLTAHTVDEVSLIAVSKTKPNEQILNLYNEGQRIFGENKLQELEVKSPALPADIEWHYIGKVQRNKIRKIIQYSNWIHGVDSEKLLLAIDRVAGEEEKKPNLFLQVNIDQEESKGGFIKEDLQEIAEQALSLAHINIVGLMCIPSPQENAELVRPSFKALSGLRRKLELELDISLPFLSMGMSADYHIAVEEGATHVRVGSALFGARNYTV